MLGARPLELGDLSFFRDFTSVFMTGWVWLMA